MSHILKESKTLGQICLKPLHVSVSFLGLVLLTGRRDRTGQSHFLKLRHLLCTVDEQGLFTTALKVNLGYHTEKHKSEGIFDEFSLVKEGEGQKGDDQSWSYGTGWYFPSGVCRIL